LTGLVVFQPFANWRHNHASITAAPATSPARHGDVETLTAAEYAARPWRGRLAYVSSQPGGDVRDRPDLVADDRARLWTRGMRPRQQHSVQLTNLALVVLLGA